MKKILTYNVNGIRSAINKGFIEWLKSVNPDIVLLQEVKAESIQIDLSEIENSGYRHYWHSAEKKGYSGVAIFSKVQPDNIVVGSGDQSKDCEGRILRVDFGEISVMSVYIPSGSSGEIRQKYKIEWLSWFYNYIDELKKTRPYLIIGGDINICHQPVDIHNPVSNKNSSGFLPEEREWLGKFLNNGFTDSFRHFNKEPHQYTWWSFRVGARARNLGWRIDYILNTSNLDEKLLRSVILPEAKHSDHCPVLTEIDF